jgi:OHCU decarboxylase
MTQTLKLLNELPADQAEAEFLKCCGSPGWARAMTAARPFLNREELLEKAEYTWWSLSAEDWLEAFRAHPRIGEKQADVPQSRQAHSWSAREQSGTEGAAANTKAALAEGNRKYESRFGFIYIVFATGKSAEEMLSNLNRRLENDRETELSSAAEEQRKITRLRLEKLLSQ